MEKKHKIELAIVAVFSMAIVIIAPSILRLADNDTEKMIIKPLLYCLLVASPFIFSKKVKRPIGTLGFKKENILKQVLIGFLIFVVIALLLTIAVFALGDNKRVLLSSPKNGFGIILYYVIFNILFVGMGEEILFRGYFLERFKKLTNSKTLGVVLSAGMFGIWHFPGGQDFLQVLLTALIGAIYAMLVFKFKNCSTLSVGIAHGLHDIYILALSCILL